MKIILFIAIMALLISSKLSADYNRDDPMNFFDIQDNLGK